MATNETVVFEQTDQQRRLQLRELIRFGFEVAELRGRVLFGDRDPAGVQVASQVRRDHALPLFVERSPKEQLIEVKKVTKALGERNGLALKGHSMKDQLGNKPTDEATGVHRVLELADQVPFNHSHPAWQGTSAAFAEAIYLWDADIQDELAQRPYGEASAYQLGRGLAELTWTLVPSTPRGMPNSWEIAFSRSRCLALTWLLERLSADFPDMAAKTVMGSLAVWQSLSEDQSWRGQLGTAIYLRRQVQVWRDLLVTGADPETLVHPHRPHPWNGSIIPALRAVWIECAVAGIGVVLLIAAAYAFSLNNGGAFAPITTILGIVGVTSASIGAKAKSSLTAITGQIRSAVKLDLLTEAATDRPSLPRRSRRRERQRPLRRSPGVFSGPITTDFVLRAGEIDLTAWEPKTAAVSTSRESKIGASL